MNNSTVIAIKADVSKFEDSLSVIRKETNLLYDSFTKSSKEATSQQKKIDDLITKSESTVKKYRNEILSLETSKQRLSDKDKKRLSDLKKDLRDTTKINKEIIRQEREKLKQIKRNISSTKYKINQNKSQLSFIKGETSERKKLENSIKKERIERDKNNVSSREEIKGIESSTNAIVRKIRRLESLFVAYYALTRAYNSTIGAGVELNKEYENLELGLSAVLASKTKGIDITGKEVDAYKRFSAAQIDTADKLKKLKKASIDTPASFIELSGLYQQSLGHALQSGDSFGSSINEISDNTINLTKRMSNLGAAVGMQMDKVNEEIRSLMSGNTSTDSILSMILFGSPTAANKAIREAKKRTGGLTSLFEKVFDGIKPLEGIDTYTKTMNAFGQEIDKVRIAASKPVFEDYKKAAKSITEYLKSDGEDMSDAIKNIYSGVKHLIDILPRIAIAYASIKTVGYIENTIRSTIAMGDLGRAITITAKKQKYFNLIVKENPYILAAAAAVAFYSLIRNEIEKTASKKKEIDLINERKFSNWKALGDRKEVDNARKSMEISKLNYDKMLKINAEAADIFYKKEYEKAKKHYDSVVKAAISSNDNLLSKLDTENQKSLRDRYDEINKKISLKTLELKVSIKNKDKKSSENIYKDIEKLKKQLKDIEPQLKDYVKLIGIKKDIEEDISESIKAQNDLNTTAYETYIRIIGTDYDKWLLSTNKTMLQLSKSTVLSTKDIIRVYNKLYDDFNNKKINPIDNYDKYLEIIGNDYEKWLQKTNKNIIDLYKTGLSSSSEISKYFSDELDKFNSKDTKNNTKIDTFNISEDDWKSYFNKIGDYEKEWLIVSSKLRQKYFRMSEKDFKKIEEQEKKDFYSDKKGKNIFDGWDSIVSQQLVNGIQDALNGEFDLTKLLSSMSSQIGNSMMQSGMNAGISNLSKGIGFGSGNLYAMGAGIGLMAVSDLMKPYVETITEQTNYLEQIADSTSSMASNLDTFYNSGGSYTGAFNGDILKDSSMKVRDSMFGSLLNIFGTTDKYIGYEKGNKIVNFNFKDSNKLLMDQINKETKEYMSMLGNFSEDENYNLLVGWERITKEKKVLGITIDKSKYTKYYFKKVNELEANLISYLAQFGVDTKKKSKTYGQLTKDGLEKYKEVLGQSYKLFDSIAEETARANGTLDQYLRDKNNTDKEETLQKIRDIYGKAYKDLGYNLNAVSASNLSLYYNEQTMKELIATMGGNFNVETWNMLFDSLSGSLSNVADSSIGATDSIDGIADSLKQLDDLYLGNYSPLSMKQKEVYAMSTYQDSIGTQNELDNAYYALETAATTATRDEDIIREFNNVSLLLEYSAQDSTRTDIVNQIITLNSKIDDLTDETIRIRETTL